MNKESNKYIYIYSLILVVVVALVLSLSATLLKPFQQKNAEIEKKYNILCAVQKAKEVQSAKNKTLYIEEEYSKYIVESFALNSFGERLEADAFIVDLEKEAEKSMNIRKFPVFVCVEDDSSRKFIIPLRGSGLWGPIWGYIALQEDCNTICGVVFDHKSETPGLGAEISSQQFQRQFVGKQLFEGNNFVSIKLIKGGANRGNLGEVDAISGGTITGQGLESMLRDVLVNYLSFLQKQQNLLANSSLDSEAEQATAIIEPKEKKTVVAPKQEQVVMQEEFLDQQSTSEFVE
ncbi:MAG: NADH:ubiquinone reductase (Na(+)-transporting) subunit C [Bacteroidales bacterium]